ncbi:MAG: oligosaccharide flippase family protein, partial [Clostridia bacterium]|nr:oligosaccharide flippase family protein [Clostridia bacterium]
MRTGGKSLTKNVIYQTLYNILSTITPLITTPIISREMGSGGLGIFSYTLTVSHYFTLFAMLGIVNYGTRAIAEAQKTKESLSRTFFSVYAIQFSMAAVCNVAYFAYVFLLA